jgi:putative DNA primase/helicase
MSGRGSTAWTEAGIPAELRALARWVAWRYIERDGRATKVPLCARTGAAASAIDPATWTDYIKVAQYARTHGCGIGIMLGDGLAGVDLDDCVTETGETAPWARDIIAALASYTETSPSGHGVHVLVRGTLPGSRRRRGCIEMYDRDRYFCVTGRHLGGTPATVEERTTELAALHRRVFSVPGTSTAVRSAMPAARLCASDSEIVERAHRARNGDRFGRLWRGDASDYTSRSEADLALCSLLAWYTDDADQIARLVAQSGLAREKWARADYRERTIVTALASVGACRTASAKRVAHTDALVARELGL